MPCQCCQALVKLQVKALLVALNQPAQTQEATVFIHLQVCRAPVRPAVPGQQQTTCQSYEDTATCMNLGESRCLPVTILT
jgi:hypothetical protein